MNNAVQSVNALALDLPEEPAAHGRRWTTVHGVMAAVVTVLCNASIALATTSGTGNLPWNAPLQNLLNNLTGPTARVVVGLGVAVCGLIWMMRRHEEGAGRLGQAIVGGALVFGAQVFVGAIGFRGALI